MPSVPGDATRPDEDAEHPPSEPLDLPGIASGERFLARAAVMQRASRATTALAAAGIGAGDSVALVLRNDIAFFEATLAAGALGAYAVPVNWHASPEETAYVLSDCGAKLAVAHADLLRRLDGALPPGCSALAVETPPEIADAYHVPPAQAAAPPGVPEWDALVSTHEPWDRPRMTAPPTMIYTSGTTGRPKGVRRAPFDPELVSLIVRQNAEVFGIGPGIRTVIPAPLYHTAPNAYALTVFRQRGTLVLQPRFDAADLLRLIETWRITHLQVVPTMFVRLLRLPAEVRLAAECSSLRHVVHAAAPCPPDVKRRMIEWWGPIIREYYGCTESGAATFCDSGDWLARPGTVGRPLPGAAVRILDDAGRDLPAGTPGDVYLRQPAFGDFSYHGRPADTDAVRRGGFMTCGDIGYLDAEGWLFLCDRRRDLVISGGANIYPAAIESVLLDMPGVADCALFGIPDDDLGEVLAAAVEPEPGVLLTDAAVREFLAARLGRHELPRVVTFHAELPREDSGKIFKRRLRDPYWEGTGRAI